MNKKKIERKVQLSQLSSLIDFFSKEVGRLEIIFVTKYIKVNVELFVVQGDCLENAQHF